MAPKAAAKAKDVKAEPSTPKPKVKSEAPETPKKTPNTTARKRPAAPPPLQYAKLSVEDGVNAPINVNIAGSQQASAAPTGGYRMDLKLDAQNAFTVVKTVSCNGALAQKRIDHATNVPSRPF